MNRDRHEPKYNAVDQLVGPHSAPKPPLDATVQCPFTIAHHSSNEQMSNTCHDVFIT